MARPIWTGTLSFGLLNVPVSLMPGERKTDLSFRLLDARDNSPIRYEKVNADTGDEVPWKDIVKAYEYDKGSYVVLEPEDIKSAASDSRETVEVEAFVDANSIGPQFYEKPYVLVPGKKAEKGYVLLRETLKKTGKIGIARVVIRTREYLSAVMPHGDALLLTLLRYPQEIVDIAEYKIPDRPADEYRISPKELEMAQQLIESMAGEWTPGDYRDEFRERLTTVIQNKMKSKGLTPVVDDDGPAVAEDLTTNVVDFMALLQQSLAKNARTPAKGSKDVPVEKVADKSSKAKPAEKRAAAENIPKKATRKS